MIGSRIGHYEITGEIGRGGMGEVYRARDTKLNRDVALKILPQVFAQDSERMARFEREAQVLASLNHSNIAQIYGFAEGLGSRVRGLVLELVPGETLQEQIAHGPIRVDEALKIALQICEGLEAAHEKGIIHRDLKPANIKITPVGQVKILDFGLAKALEDTVDGQRSKVNGLSHSPTLTHQSTQAGVILGTAAYMSPEQARGKTVDRRTDIWAFGCVLFEMLTGKRVFEGESLTDVLASIIKEEPDWDILPVELPLSVRRLLKHCFSREVRNRFQSIGDVRVVIQEGLLDRDNSALQAPVIPSGRLSRFSVTSVALLSFVGGCLLTSLVWLLWQQTGSQIELPPMRELPLSSSGWALAPSFSPDGSAVVFNEVNEEGTTDIYVRLIGTESSTPLARGLYPAWSPDGRWIAFGREGPGSENSILIIPRLGGAEREICKIRNYRMGLDKLVSWTPDSDYLITAEEEIENGPLHLTLVSVESGEKRPLTFPEKGILGDTGPSVSPGGRQLLFTRQRSGGVSNLFILELDTDYHLVGDPKQFTFDIPNANYAVWTPNGQGVVFCSRVFHDATLWRTSLDSPEKSFPLGLGGHGAYHPDIALQGNLLAYHKRIWDMSIYAFAVPENGEEPEPPEKFVASQRLEVNPEYSPDGRKVAFVSDRSGNQQIWTCDPDGGNLLELTKLNATWVGKPRWSPSGEWIAFEVDHTDVYVVRSRGGATMRLTGEPAIDRNPEWSGDGEWILFTSERGGRNEVWKIRPEGEEPVLAEVEAEAHGRVSPYDNMIYGMTENPNGISLWRWTNESGEREVILTDSACWDFALTSDGVYYIAKSLDPVEGEKWQLAVYSWNRRETSFLTPVSKGSGVRGEVSVSPDGRTVLFTQTDREGGDLVLVENFR